MSIKISPVDDFNRGIFLLFLQQVEFLLWCKSVGGLLGVLSNLECCCSSYVAAAVTDTEGVITCFGNPLAVSLVEACQIAYGDSHGENLTLAGLQLAGLGKCLELLSWLLKLAFGCLNINLSYFLTAHLTGVLNGDANLNGILALSLHYWL